MTTSRRLPSWLKAKMPGSKNYIEVKNYWNAIQTNKYNKELACLITSNHNIPIGEFTFWDWEDED